MAVTQLPSQTTLTDGQFIQVQGPDQLLSGFQYDINQRALWARESQVIIPSHHGMTHIAEDPVPQATCDTQGLMSPDDKCKLDSLLQTRMGVLGFMGAGFPDDGGWMSGDIILAAGTEYISLERVGNVIRFTVDSPTPLNCNCETCTQLYWVQDETAVSAIRPPTCGGVLPDANLYGAIQVFLFPESTIVDPANAAATLNNKNNYPAFLFQRYNNGIAPGLAQLQVILKRNANNKSVTEVGEAMTPGPAGIPEKVWFMGLDDDGDLIRFDLDVNTTPGLLGGVLYKGHLITKQMAVIVDYTPSVLNNNQYVCQLWDVVDAEALGDTFVATNTWRYINPQNTPSTPGAQQALVLDITIDVLPIGTLVDIWRFQIGEIAGTPVYRYFFKEAPSPSLANAWTMLGAIEFGDTVVARGETEGDAGGSAGKHDSFLTSAINDFEPSIWGLTGFDMPVMLDQVVESHGTVGSDINTQHRAIIDTSLPGLLVTADYGTEPFSQRPVVLWNRIGMENSALVRAEIGRPGDNQFTPYDVLLQAPISSYANVYMQVIGKGQVNGVNFVRVVGASFHDLPRSGTVRIMNQSSGVRNHTFNFYNKLLWPMVDNNSITLMAEASDNCHFAGNVGDVVELVQQEYSAPCVRLQFNNDPSGTVSLQFKVGILGMNTEYEEDNPAIDNDDFVRGLMPGYAVSAVYSQDHPWSGVGPQPPASIDGFYVYEGGAASGNEYWNVLEIMLRSGQVWIWWNGLLIPPSGGLSSLLPTPVTISTPYYPLNTGRVYGKCGMRMWPGSTIRRVSVRTQPRAFSEFTYGQLQLT